MDQFIQIPAPQNVTPRNSTLAIVSFIMGLLCMTCLFWPLLGLPAIICGIIALVKISGSNGALRGKGYAITGIIIPSIMTLLIPVIGILLAILFPALSQARDAAVKLQCANNERQLAMAMMTYANDYSGKLPEGDWMEAINKAGMIKGENVLTCRTAEEMAVSYVLNKNIKNLNEVKNPARTVLIFEGDSDADGLGGSEDIVFPHTQGTTEGCNVGFVDGHTELVTIENKGNLLWFPDQQ
jgi:prepilin-type processing-associated H-X9-DG protein